MLRDKPSKTSNISLTRKYSKKNSSQPKSPQAFNDDSTDERPLTASDIHSVKDELLNELKAIKDSQSKLTSKFDELQTEFHEIRNEFKELQKNQSFLSNHFVGLNESSKGQATKIDELARQNVSLRFTIKTSWST